MSKNTLIIAAGGVGKRAGLGIPKQFATLCGKPVIAHTICVFEECSHVEEIIISCHKDFISHAWDIVKKYGFKKVTSVIAGGSTRQESVYNAIKEVGEETEYILIHDAARPFINIDSIERCLVDAKKYGCAAVGKRVSDTLKRTDVYDVITDTVDRNNLWQIQTPQIFKKDIIKECHEKCALDNTECTDDCMLCEKYGYSVKITEASSVNMKITEQSDIILAEAILNV